MTQATEKALDALILEIAGGACDGRKVAANLAAAISRLTEPKDRMALV